MRIVKMQYELPSENSTVYLVGFGDWHVGNANMDRKVLFDMRDFIAENQCLWWMMGDAAECITVKDERWASGGIDTELLDEPRSIDYFVDRQMEFIRDFVAPIMDKCVCWHEGNHEAKYSKNTGHSPILESVLAPHDARHLWTPGSQNTVIEFTCDGQRLSEIVVNSAHGNKTAQYIGSLIHWQIQRLRTYDDVAVLMRGHHHHNFAVKVANIHTTKGKRPILKDREAVVVGTGSALRTLREGNVCYSEAADYQPVVLGFPMVQVNVEGRRVKLYGVS